MGDWHRRTTVVTVIYHLRPAVYSLMLEPPALHTRPYMVTAQSKGIPPTEVFHSEQGHICVGHMVSLTQTGVYIEALTNPSSEMEWPILIIMT